MDYTALSTLNVPADSEHTSPLDVSRRRLCFLLVAVAFIPLKCVRVKMLPFDHKSEFQIMIDMPDGTPLEQTTLVAHPSIIR